MKITFYAHTAQGKRPRQEDNFTILDFPTTGQQIAAVADGMGGHPRGADASREAIEPFRQVFAPTAFRSEKEATAEMRRVMRLADDAVTRLGLEDPADIGNYRFGPGSTLTVVAAHPAAPYQLVLGHIGDSRAYLFRAEQGGLVLTHLTRDHSEGPYIDRALGNWDSDRSVQSGNEWQLDDNGKPSPYDVRIVKVQPGDMILLCSDGVHGVLGDEPIVDAFCLSVIAGAAAIPPALVDDALNAGSSDNCTVVLGVVES